MRPLTFKAEDEDIQKWKDSAHRDRISLGAWIRLKLNAPTAPALLGIAKTRSPGGPKKCEHRIPPGSWCKTCQIIKK